MAVGKYVTPSFLDVEGIDQTQRHLDDLDRPRGNNRSLTASQEQEIVKGQEGPQEEGPGPLCPQGLVRDQGMFAIQRLCICRDDGLT